MDVGAGNGFVGAYYNDYNVGAYYNESFAAGMERFVSYRHDVIMKETLCRKPLNAISDQADLNETDDTAAAEADQQQPDAGARDFENEDDHDNEDDDDEKNHHRQKRQSPTDENQKESSGSPTLSGSEGQNPKEDTQAEEKGREIEEQHRKELPQHSRQGQLNSKPKLQTEAQGMPSAVSGGGGGGGNHTGGGGGNGNNMNPQTNEECGIRDVWRHNLDEEFRTIRHIVQKYHYVAMDTEFPGVVARPVGEFRSSADYQYQFLRCNVDLLRIIQLGLTFMDEEGHTPPGFSTWQFNFKFNLNEDMYAQDSIDLLQNSGIQFKKHEEDGIDPLDFAELLMTSGIVLMDNIKWLSFHSGYDFGYLLKLLTDQNLPAEESDFFELLRIYFPTIYDVKYLMKSCKNLKGGLQEVADQLELRRVGPQHQAGSDSLLTGMAFFKMREMFFEDNIDNAKYCGHLYGLGTSFIVNGSSNTISSSTNNSSSATISNSNANANTGSGTTGTSGAGTGGNGGTTSSSNNSNNNNNNNNNNTNSSSGNNYHDNGETNATS